MARLRDDAKALATRAWDEERVLAVLGLANLALVPVFLVLMAFDGRTVLGLDPWVKPAKFAGSVGLYLLTIACLLVPLRRGKARATVRWTTAMLLPENLAIFVQGARATPSHFNEDTAADAILFSVMGVLIAIVVLGSVLLLVLYLVPGRTAQELPRPLRVAIVLGLLIALVGGAIGGAMISRGGHTVGGEDGGEGLPYLSWSTEHGDLRPAHFVALHALQAIPLLGVLVVRRELRRGTAVVVAAAVVYAVLVLPLYLQALRGEPLFAVA